MDKNYEDMNLLELAAAMKGIREQLDATKELATSYQKQFDLLRLRFIPEMMEEQGIRNITLEGIGRVGLTADFYCSTPAENREAVRRWMVEHDHGSLVSETINASTLKSWVKNQLTEGDELPCDLEGEPLLNVSPFTRASITKA